MVRQLSLLAEIANQCVDVPFETDFSEVLSSEEGLFESFPSVDAACSVEIISTFAEEFCSSNDIVVSLQDSIVSPPINTSCSSDDQGTAFSEPVYAPLEPLSAFQGDNVNQVWTLTVTDSKNGNIGTLNSWTLFFDIER